MAAFGWMRDKMRKAMVIGGISALPLLTGGLPAIAQDQPVIPPKRVMLMAGTDLPGGDLATLLDMPLQSCIRACLDNDQCEALTFNDRSRACFPKGAQAGERTPFTGAFSGLVVPASPDLLDRAATRRSAAPFPTADDLIFTRQRAEPRAHRLRIGTPELVGNAEVRFLGDVVIGLMELELRVRIDADVRQAQRQRAGGPAFVQPHIAVLRTVHLRAVAIVADQPADIFHDDDRRRFGRWIKIAHGIQGRLFSRNSPVMVNDVLTRRRGDVAARARHAPPALRISGRSWSASASAVTGPKNL